MTKLAALRGTSATGRRSAASCMIVETPVRLSVSVCRWIGLPLGDVPRQTHQSEVVTRQQSVAISPVNGHSRKLAVVVEGIGDDLLPVRGKTSGLAMVTRLVVFPSSSHLGGEPFNRDAGQPNVVLQLRALVKTLCALYPHVMEKHGFRSMLPNVLSPLRILGVRLADHAIRMTRFPGGSTGRFACLKARHGEDAAARSTDRLWHIRIDQISPVEIGDEIDLALKAGDQEGLPGGECLALTESDFEWLSSHNSVAQPHAAQIMMAMASDGAQ
jgi:hypothetical protein